MTQAVRYAASVCSPSPTLAVSDAVMNSSKSGQAPKQAEGCSAFQFCYFQCERRGRGMSLGTDSRLPSPSSVGALVPALPVWGLFGRFLLMLIGQILVVPSPWTSTAYYKFLCEHIALPDGKRLKFAGQAGDIWYVFIALALMIWFDQVIHYAGLPRYVGYLAGPAIWVLTVLLLKWFCANLRSEDDRLALRFEGGYWAYIGWNILLIVSALTIVGWAWVLKFMMRWMCRSVRGTASFDLNATGFGILWRTFGFVLLGILVIPIPWLMRWYASWLISQISVAQPSGNASAA
jgi:hypothetical protein